MQQQQVESLWPVIKEKPDVVPPVRLLRQQADLFTDMMQHMMVAQVNTTTVADASSFSNMAKGTSTQMSHLLNIRVPSLGNYSFTVLEMVHDPKQLYPIRIIDKFSGKSSKSSNIVYDEKDAIEVLKKILGAADLQNAISSLLAQVKYLGSPN
jgi:hypothetical protein